MDVRSLDRSEILKGGDVDSEFRFSDLETREIGLLDPRFQVPLLS